jgi:hypothetical protein
MAIQRQLSTASAAQVCASACAEHGSIGGTVPPSTLTVSPPEAVPVPEVPEPDPDAGAVVVGTAVVLPDPLAPTGTGPLEHPQLQAGQVSPAAQTGQAHAQVPPPVPVPVAQPLLPQSQLQGGQVWPGAQAGHAQVQVPPPALPLPPSEAGGGGQSQVTEGQSALAGHATGCAHAHPPPVASAAWQNPLPVQS